MFKYWDSSGWCMMRSILLSIIAVLLVMSAASFVSADLGVEYIAVRNCRLMNLTGLGGLDAVLNSSVNLSCGADIAAVCDVENTFAGTTIISFTATLAGGTSDTETYPISGTPNNGTWYAIFPSIGPMQNVNGSVTLESVSVSSSNPSEVCGSSLNTYQSEAGGCFVNYTIPARIASTNCSCGYNVVAGNCTISNTQEMQYVGYPGCGLSDYNTTATCDFCDPQWTYVYDACVVDFTSVANPLSGTFSSVSQVALNYSCCEATQLDSDCIAPGTQQLSSTPCERDVWCSAGRTPDDLGGSHVFGSNAATLDATPVIISGNFSAGSDFNVFEPLVFDFDGDGITEIAVQTGGGLTIYGINGSIEYNVSLPNGSVWDGQAALFGFSQGFWDGEEVYGISEAVKAGTRNVGIAGLYWNSSRTFFASYKVNETTGVLGVVVAKNLGNEGLGTGRIGQGMGTACFKDQCYFLTSGGNLSRADAMNSSYFKTISNVSDPFPAGYGTNPSLVVGKLRYLQTSTVDDVYVRGVAYKRIVGTVSPYDVRIGYTAVQPYARVLSEFGDPIYLSSGVKSAIGTGRNWMFINELNDAVRNSFDFWFAEYDTEWIYDCFDHPTYCVPSGYATPISIFTLGTGETGTYTVDGVDYEITVTYISNDLTKFRLTVNGEPTQNLTWGVKDLPGNHTPDNMTAVLSGGFVLTGWGIVGNSTYAVVAFSFSSKGGNGPYLAMDVPTSQLNDVRDLVATVVGVNRATTESAVVYGIDGQNKGYSRYEFDVNYGTRSPNSVSSGPTSLATYVNSLAKSGVAHVASSTADYNLIFVGSRLSGGGVNIAALDAAGNFRTMGTTSENMTRIRVLFSDVTGDGQDELITSSGIYDITGSTITRLVQLPGYNGNFQQYAAVGIVDIDANRVLDYFWMNTTKLYLYLSEKGVDECLSADVLAVGGLDCFPEEDGIITAKPFGVTSPQCSQTYWYSNLLTETGTVISSFPPSEPGPVLPMHTYTVYTPGRYNVTGYVWADTQSVVATCSVVQTSVGVLPPSQGCQFNGGDAEFNYYGEAPSDNGWFVVSGEPLITTDGWASFNQYNHILYTVNCSSAEQVFEAKVNDQGAGSWQMLIDSFAQEPTGQQYVEQKQTAGVWYLNGQLYAMTGSGQILIGAAGAGVEHTVQIYLNRTNRAFYVGLNGAQFGPYNYSNPTYGPTSGVRLRSLDCDGVCTMDFRVDYVRFNVSGGAVREWTPDQSKIRGALAYLGGCVETSERNFDTSPAGSLNYSNVNAYCTAVHAGEATTYCTMEDLRRAVRVNTKCYAEAFSYCVAVTFPQTGLVEEEEMVQSAGLDGAASCGMSLGVSVGVDRVAIPTFEVIWNLVIHNPILTLVILLSVVLIALTSLKRV